MLTVAPTPGSLEAADIGGVSVVIPAYNAADYIAATIQSVLAQSVRPREVIVVDDGSTDATREIAATFPVTLIAQSNRGCSVARNTGTEAASGEFIAYLDADDLWHPHKLARQLAAHRAFGRPAFSFTDYRWFDTDGVHQRTTGLAHHRAFRRVVKTHARRTPTGDLCIAADRRRPVLPDCYIQPSSLLVRRADVLAVGGFDPAVRFGEDYEFCLRLFRHVPALAVMESLLLYRRHPAQITANQRAFQTGLLALAQHVAEAPERYPLADVRHIAQAEHVRYYRLGIEQARHEEVDRAAQSFARSWAARPTLGAGLALGATQLCRSSPGRRTLSRVRRAWKRRPQLGAARAS